MKYGVNFNYFGMKYGNFVYFVLESGVVFKGNSFFPINVRKLKFFLNFTKTEAIPGLLV